MLWLKTRQYKTKSLYINARLQESLDGIFEHPLTIVEAPMGYGKTTAVKELLRKPDAAVFWLRVYSDSVETFWNEFTSLFSQIDHDICSRLTKLGIPVDAVAISEALQLINGLNLSKKSVIVIDDYHQIDSPEINDFFEMLAKSEIENLHTILATRFSGLESLEELELKGLLHHITQKSFELLPQEIAEYYHACGIHITTDQAQELFSTTDGWISALYLMMLEYISNGNLEPPGNIYKLIEKAVYMPLSDEAKEFILSVSVFDSFTLQQAKCIWSNENAGRLLDEIIKNAFVNYDGNSKTYRIHSLYKEFLQDILNKRGESYRYTLYRKAADWHRGISDYGAARQFWYLCEDYENLLQSIEDEKARNFTKLNLGIMKKYFHACPKVVKSRHHYALLIFAVHLFVHNEFETFIQICQEVNENIQSDDSLSEEQQNELLGELEILNGFSVFNDLKKMSQSFERAWRLLGRVTSIYDIESDWTFGSPSVLYLYYRESGKLQEHLTDLREGLPYYYRLTKGNGNGGEYVMEAEWYYNMGDLVNAEISLNRAQHKARLTGQWSIELATMFLQMRINFMKGDFENLFPLLSQIRKDMTDRVEYQSLRTVELCEMGLYSWIGHKCKIPESVAQPETGSIRLMFTAHAMFNIIYGRILLIHEKYTALLGSADHFLETASVYPNLLGIVYTHIFLAAANLKLFRENEAHENLKKAMDIAMPDKLFMPFVENCDYIEPLLRELSFKGLFRKDIERILALYKTYAKSKADIIAGYFSGDQPKLTEREMDISHLVADGLTNQEIAERLCISINTVKAVLKTVYAKLAINNRIHLKKYVDELDDSVTIM